MVFPVFGGDSRTDSFVFNDVAVGIWVDDITADVFETRERTIAKVQTQPGLTQHIASSCPAPRFLRVLATFIL